ncbi:MAG: hypothetical protein AB7E32_03880 [Desulfovibrio sp.]
MGKLLQIRVSAATYDEAGVVRIWPRLSRLAWGVDRVPGAAYGVLELGRTLAEKKRLGMLSREAVAVLADGPERLEELVSRLESALGDWKASEANRLSDDLEDALSELEKAAEKL